MSYHFGKKLSLALNEAVGRTIEALRLQSALCLRSFEERGQDRNEARIFIRGKLSAARSLLSRSAAIT
jgi:hypothetical protein